MVGVNFPRIQDTKTGRVSVGVLITLFLVVSVATGGAAAQSAPDCSTVSYNGDGSSANPYEISTTDQLQCIEDQGLNFNYEVVSDIDASETSLWNDGDGFIPIGEESTEGTPFTGTFDGAGYEITDLTINRQDEDYIGMFAEVGTPGTVTGISVVDVNVIGNIAVGGIVGNNEGTVTKASASGSIISTGPDTPYSSSDVGGIAGQNSGTVSKSSASGDVTGNSSVGGLVGANNGGAVLKSSSSGDVTGSGVVGGLVGVNFYPGTVSESSASGDIIGSDKIGGLVGRNGAGDAATVKMSYATGNVDAAGDQVGGLVGFNDGGILERTYAVGGVTGNGSVGGLVGDNQDTVEDSYWDIEDTGQPFSDGGTGLTTEEMTGSAASINMDGFDFADTWVTVTDPDDYPILVWQTEDDTEVFTDPLPGFNEPPTNTENLDPNLFEDVNGDGDGTDPSQSVNLWTHLIIDEQDFDDLTQEQVDALDWNGDGQLTPADAVSLWTEQVLA